MACTCQIVLFICSFWFCPATPPEKDMILIKSNDNRWILGRRGFRRPIQAVCQHARRVLHGESWRACLCVKYGKSRFQNLDMLLLLHRPHHRGWQGGSFSCTTLQHSLRKVGAVCKNFRAPAERVEVGTTLFGFGECGS